MNARHARSVCPTPSKQSYADEQIATAALHEVRSRVDLNLVAIRLPVRAYHCSCRRWHLTSRAVASTTPYDPPRRTR